MAGKGLIYILDMESSLIESLAKRVIEMGPYCILRPWTMNTVINAEDELRTYGDSIKGIIISGSGKNINSTKYEIPQIPVALLRANIPILAICYGMQYLGHVLGTPIIRCWEEPDPTKRTKEQAKKDKGEQGPVVFQKLADSVLFQGIGPQFPVWMKHNWMLAETPQNWTPTGSTDKCPVAAMERGNVFAVQFHPEPATSMYGRIILRNFLTEICGVDTPYF